MVPFMTLKVTLKHMTHGLNFNTNAIRNIFIYFFTFFHPNPFTPQLEYNFISFTDTGCAVLWFSPSGISTTC